MRHISSNFRGRSMRLCRYCILRCLFENRGPFHQSPYISKCPVTFLYYFALHMQNELPFSSIPCPYWKIARFILQNYTHQDRPAQSVIISNASCFVGSFLHYNSFQLKERGLLDTCLIETKTTQSNDLELKGFTKKRKEISFESD